MQPAAELLRYISHGELEQAIFKGDSIKMCLFKGTQQETGCFHEGCKNYYQLNKRICTFYNRASLENRSKLETGKEAVADQLQKKVKKGVPQAIPQRKDSSLREHSFIKTNQNFTLDNLLSSQMPPRKQEEDTLQTGMGRLSSLLLSQNQNYQQNTILPTFRLNTTPTADYSNLSLSPLVTLKSLTNTPGLLSAPSKFNEPPKIYSLARDRTTEISQNEFQERLFNLIFAQNRMITELKEKSGLVQDTLDCLISEVSALKNAVKNPTNETYLPTMAIHREVFGQSVSTHGATCNTETLLTYLHGPSYDFPYQLVLKQELSLPLYKERNFKFTVLLVNKQGDLVENTNRIPISLGLYSAEHPPQHIGTNTAGNKIFKGLIEKDLVNGSVTFEKIQIKEVTSHFRDGWVFLVVYPKTLGSENMVTFNGKLNSVESGKIKPLVLEKVVVKAKKSKEKGRDIEVEEEIQYTNEEEAQQTKEESSNDDHI